MSDGDDIFSDGGFVGGGLSDGCPEDGGQEGLDDGFSETEEYFSDLCGSPDDLLDSNGRMREKYVAGYLADEVELEPAHDREPFSNWEINEDLANYFRFFGTRDMDVIYLSFLSGKKQEDIMRILNKSQPAVSYDIARIREQMSFVVKMVSSIDDFIMYVTDPENPMSLYDKEMLTLFFYSTSIVKTSRLMGINNITCRSHLNTIVNRMLSRGDIDMYNLFKYIMANLNNIKKFVPRE